MQKIEIGENRIYIFLDHRKLINDACSISGEQKYTLRPELFEFRPKKSKTDSEVPRKKRKKSQKTEDTQENEGIQEVIAILKSTPELLQQSTGQYPNANTMSRIWEQLSADDFPKFKGANNTNSFQLVENFIRGDISFIIPPNCQFYNYDISKLLEFTEELPPAFDIIVLDPPWRNKYIRRLKRHHLGYNMLDCRELQDIPVGKLINESSVVIIWCTNSKQHQDNLLNHLIPAWKLRFLHVIKWLKLNTLGEPITDECENGKQPFEMLYIACHHNAAKDFGTRLKNVEMIMSIPSIIHSHKPPLVKFLQDYLPLGKNPKCLELFARYMQPNFTSFGLEVLKLMDTRLYNKPELKSS